MESLEIIAWSCLFCSVFCIGYIIGFLWGRTEPNYKRSNLQNNAPDKPRTEEEATEFLIARVRCSRSLSFDRQKMYIEAMLKLNQEVRELRKKYQ